MPRHSESKALPYSAAQMFDLVADVRAYPQFLPWVIGMRVRDETPTNLTADMIVGFKMLRETFTSRVALDRPKAIRIDYINGPLKFLNNEWDFRDTPDGGCTIDFLVDFEFRNRLFETMAGSFFHEAFRRMVHAFEKRAEAIYGSNSSSAQRTA